MDEVLRRSAAHVLVADLTIPVADEAAAHHLRRVLRLRDGEVVTATDGAGGWRTCRFAGGALEVDGEVHQVADPVAPLTIAVAPPKGDRMDWLVQKCTEVGVDHLVVLTAERSVVRWDGDRAERQLRRLRRVAVEAAMQSRRVRLPTITGPVPATELLPGAVAAEPSGRPLAPADTIVAIGPEGGWSPVELAVAADTVSLGETVLRVETAAVVAAALLTAARTALR
jgi:16S rRNA (uracil1498-N3)-methyltransferase